MKDIYFSDMNNDDMPILTPEEIKLIKERRRQKMAGAAGSGDDTFITPPNIRKKSEYNSDFDYDPREYTEFKKKPVQVNVQYDDEYEDNYEDYDSYAEEPQPRKKKISDDKKKKGCGCGCLSAVFAVFLALVIAVVGCFGFVLNKMNDMKIEESHTNSYVNSSELKKADGVKNILLIGLDEDQGDGNSRSDTMMLLTIDTINNAIKLTSFLRDMWVEIPDYKDAKLNASYSHGGAQLTMDTIEYNFDVDIDNYILVDFNMFRKIIDALGGIEIEITEKEAEFINRTTSSVVEEGINQLNGKKALIYARIRKLDSDFGRTERQRKVIMAIVDKVKEINPLELINIVTDILPMITTDINPIGMVTTAISALGCLQYDIQQMQIPASDAYSSKTIRGQAALVPDLEKNIENLKEFIYGEGE